MTDTETPFLELRNVTKTYKIKQGLFGETKSLNALKDLSLKLSKGDVLGLVGESGCGKSTLAKILLGLEAPTSGQVLVDGTPIGGHDRLALARRIQPIFQDPYSSLNPRKTIQDLIALPLRVHKVGDEASRTKAVREILDVVGLPSRVLTNYPSQMSGGQRQRVAIARALVMRPQIVICDEPTSALDVSVQSQILNLLGDLRQEFGLTYLFISHDLAVVASICDTLLVMQHGQALEYGAASDILNNPTHAYTRSLLTAAGDML